MTTHLIPEFDIFKMLMDPRAGANLRCDRLEPSHSIPVVSINNNREERSEIGYEARMMGSWTINNNWRGEHKRNCDFCVKGDKFGDKELSVQIDLLFNSNAPSVRKVSKTGLTLKDTSATAIKEFPRRLSSFRLLRRTFLKLHAD